MMTGTAPLAESIVARLRHHAAVSPNRRAVDMIDSLGRPGPAFSYAELDQAALRIAGVLASRYGRGARVLLAEPSGLAFIAAFFGCLYAGMIAVPVAIPRSAESDEAERFLHIARDSGAEVLLASHDAAARLEIMAPLQGLVAQLRCDIDENGAPLETPVAAKGDDIAFLQYTSGSTGSPKGVMVTHANIVHNAHRISVRCRLDERSRALIWLPLFHDLGLVGGVLTPLYAGFPTSLMEPVSFIKHPLRWLRILSEGRYTISGGPNFAFRLCVERYDARKLAGIDLSAWTCAFNCAEPIDPATLAQFSDIFAAHGFRVDAFYPCYGMAESTLSISSHAGPRPPYLFQADADRLEAGVAVPPSPGARARTLVSVGEASPDQHLVIVDPAALEECAEGQTGEIWTADASVAAGYWNRPAETALVFGGRLPHQPARAYLRTGDIGFRDGVEVFVSGRLKDLIIADGRNLHAEDIEHTVKTACNLTAMLGVAAFSVTTEGSGEELVIVVEQDRRGLADAQSLRRKIQAALVARHELGAAHIHIVSSGAVPRTTSGKVRRAAARRAYLDGALRERVAAEIAGG